MVDSVFSITVILHKIYNIKYVSTYSACIKCFWRMPCSGFTAFFSIVEWTVINFGRQCLFFCLKCSQLMHWHVMRSFPVEGKKIGYLYL